jgi:hypothetical protein
MKFEKIPNKDVGMDHICMVVFYSLRTNYVYFNTKKILVRFIASKMQSHHRRLDDKS